MAFEIVPSGDALGAEVRGVDLSRRLDADALERAWSDHLVLLFRGQKLADEDLLALAEAMGGAQEAGSRSYYIKGGYGVETGRVSRLPGISIVSNLDETGKPAKRHAGTGSQELTWHTDNSYVEQPPKGSILYAHKVPVNGGGDTSFANQYAACERLPEATRSRLPGLTVRHDSSRNTAGGLRPTVAAPASRGDMLAYRPAHSEELSTKHVRGRRYSPVMTTSRVSRRKREGRAVGRGLPGCGFALGSLPPTRCSSSSKLQAIFPPSLDRNIACCRRNVKHRVGRAADFSAVAGFSVTRWKHEGFSTPV
ncbi:MAG: TauD/TfdA family dioxygenase [Alphaproteobacteria bacterium]|nr:TauD/TfdA family dioxygenase [Alphaproteobacteria bacterium]